MRSNPLVLAAALTLFAPAVLAKTPDAPKPKAATTTPAPVAAPDLKVFGIALGEPLVLPDCPTRGVFPFEKVDDLAWAVDPMTCAEFSRPSREGDTDVGFRFLPKERPSFLYTESHQDKDDTPYFVATMLDGKVISITTRTDGVFVEDAVLAKLQAKYGKPTTIERYPISTAAGGSFEAVNATWSFTDLKVVYKGTVDEVFNGTIDFYSKEGEAAKARAKTRSDSAERQL